MSVQQHKVVDSHNDSYFRYPWGYSIEIRMFRSLQRNRCRIKSVEKVLDTRVLYCWQISKKSQFVRANTVMAAADGAASANAKIVKMENARDLLHFKDRD